MLLSAGSSVLYVAVCCYSFRIFGTHFGTHWYPVQKTDGIISRRGSFIIPFIYIPQTPPPVGPARRPAYLPWLLCKCLM
jgi:hypothetical protein